MTPPPLYPLVFSPIYKEKVWGGRTLAKLGRQLPGCDETLIGESWELADIAQSSRSGGGGGAERSVVAHGPLAGKSLHELMKEYGPSLMGRLRPTETGQFPVLIKYLDARQTLSLQTHPSPAYARDHAGAHLKSEAWYIVQAEPGAVIYKGIKAGVEARAFREVLASNNSKLVEEMLIRVPVKAGDCHYLPSGTCHALGAGILVAEVQTTSDTTYRLFDWGRQGRDMHLEEAMACIDLHPPDVARNERRSHIAGMFTAVSRLVFCEHFRIEKVRMSQEYEQEIPYDQPAVWMVLSGKGRITPGNGAGPVDFAGGQTLLIPADMNNARVRLEEDTVWLEVTFPQALTEEIA